jgi:hypothetical protein
MTALKLTVQVDDKGHLALDLPHYLANQTIEVTLQISEDNIVRDALGWPIGYFEETYGILAHDPIERGDQGVFEEREPIE